MSAEIIPFDFEEQAVRVIMRDEEPWFVAADVCRVLEIGNTSDAVKRLDDDEKDVDSIDTLGGTQRATVINESGLYALVLTSRKEQARRFRKWITSEVLPAIRRHGRYEHPGLPAGDAGTGDVFGLTFREAELLLSMVREVRLTRGTRAAASLWDRSRLPQVSAQGRGAVDPAEGRAALAHLLGALAGAIAAARDGQTEVGHDKLTACGMRALDGGLFVANFALSVYEGTRWAGGAHRAALLTLDGAAPDHGARTLGGLATRGIVLPWATIDREGL